MVDTYLDIDNSFKYTTFDGDTRIINTSNIQSKQKFTVCVCYKTQKYTSGDHAVFALCNNGHKDSGIVIKNDGVYVKGSKVLTVYGDRLATVHIVYDNRGASDPDYWSDTSCYKIYVNGVITYVSDDCPFPRDGDNKIEDNNLQIAINGLYNADTLIRE